MGSEDKQKKKCKVDEVYTWITKHERLFTCNITEEKPENDKLNNEEFPIIIDTKTIILSIQQIRTQLMKMPQIIDRFKNCNTTLTTSAQLYATDLSKTKLFIILDTNILLEDILKIENIKRQSGKVSSEYPIKFVIPLVVQRELELLVSFTKYQIADLKSLADRAIGYINKCMITHDCQMACQNLTEFKNSDDKTEKKIIQCCSYYREKYNCDAIIYSNDYNIYKEATAQSVEVCTSFHIDIYLETKFPQLQLRNVVMEIIPEESLIQIYQRWDLAFSVLIREVLMKEMEATYGDQWKDVICIQQSWQLKDLLNNVKMHWSDAFEKILKPEALMCIKKLLDKIKFISSPPIIQEIEIILNATERLLALLKCRQSYANSVEKMLTKNQKFKRQVKKVKKYMGDDGSDSDDLPPLSSTSSTLYSKLVDFHERLDVTITLDKSANENRNNNDLAVVKSAFSDIWNFIHYTCGLIIDSLGGVNPIKYNKPSTLPTVLDTKQFIGTFYVALVNLKTQLQKIIESADKNQSNTSESLYTDLSYTLENFKENLKVESGAVLRENVTAEMLRKFTNNVKARELMKSGLHQLDYFIALIYEQAYLQIVPTKKD